MRTKLTDLEYNLILELTRVTHLDEVFDIHDAGERDEFWDYENDCIMTLQDGFKELSDAISYSFQHEGFSDEEAKILENLIKEFVPDFKAYTPEDDNRPACPVINQ